MLPQTHLDPGAAGHGMTRAGSNWAGTEPLNIAAKEMLPLVIASSIWGQGWKSGRVIAHCDNAAVVSIINSRSSKDSHLAQMLRCLFFIEAYHQFKMVGVQNDLADDLSRDNLASFLSKIKNCDHEPSVIPPSLLQGLLHPGLDWTCPTWMKLFTSSVTRE